MLLRMSKKSRDGMKAVLTNRSIMQGKEVVLPNPNVLTNLLDDLDDQDLRIAELEALLDDLDKQAAILAELKARLVTMAEKLAEFEAELVTMGEELAEYKKQSQEPQGTLD